MRLLILTATLWALALAKPEMYKESENFQYSRSSSDEGTKSGFYGAQRGNMGGNYEKAHNMDSMAQHHLSTLVRQVDGELGEGANTKTGSVFSAGNSRGIYGSGNYDLSNLKGRNFGESSGYDDSQSQSSVYQNARQHDNSYYSNNAKYGSEQSLSSKQRSEYSSSNLQSQYSNSNLESENKYQGASNYDYGALGGANRYYTFGNSQARGAYDQSNTNLHSTYDSSNHNRLTSAVPVKIYLRPGGRVAVPISAPSYTLYNANLQDKKVSDSSNVLSNSESDISYKPSNNAKHYESAYSYHKKWEKHDTQPLVIVPTENPFPANSQLYENTALDQTGQRYQSELDSSNSHLSNINNGYSALQNYQSGISSASAQSSKANSAYSSGYSANTKTASASQARYQSEAQNNAASSSSNTYSLDTHNLGSSTANLNNLVEDINSRPKSYHSSFSYHKSWERRGDPYVITPSSNVNGQKSQKLTATSQNQGQFSSQQYGSQYNQKSYSNVDCDALCYQRRKRSYNVNRYDTDINNGDINLGQQSEDGWDLGQQTENKFDNLEDLGQATQNTWDNLENLGQETQNQQSILQNVGQETQNKWNNLEENVGQQTQNNWDHLTAFDQQAQSGDDDLGQLTENQSSQLENLGQETQNHFSNIEDFSQQTQGEWTKLEDLGQQTQSQLGDLGQETQNKWDSLGQQTQGQWVKLEDLGQKTQTNWGEQQDFGQTHPEDPEVKPQTQIANTNSIIKNQQEKTISNVERIEPANHKFLWDIINQMYEERPNTENSDRILKNGESESLVNHEVKPVFETEELPTDKQSKPDLLTQSNKNEQSENQWTYFGQQSENQWSNLGHQSENPWSNLGHESENHWSSFGQASENQWSNLGQESENQWSNLGQQSENQWTNIGQQGENPWSNLGQQTENQWSNFGQQSENQWSNFGQQSENQWSNFGQQSENQWSNFGQQSENQWSHVDKQQSQFIGGQQHYLNQNKTTGSAEDKAKTEMTHVEDQNFNNFLLNTYFEQVDKFKHHSQTNKQNQQETKDTENFQEDNKVLINGDSTLNGNHNVEQISHGLDITSSKLPNKTIVDTTNSKTSSEVPIPPPVINTDTTNIGRGDIGADDESFELGGHVISEEVKPNLIVYSLSSTTMKPINNEDRKPYNNILLNPAKVQVIEVSTTEKPKLPSQNFEIQNEDQQQEFDQHNLDLQQTQDELSVLPVNLNYKTVESDPPNPSKQLETVPLEKIIQKYDIPVIKHTEFAVQETRDKIETVPLEKIIQKYDIPVIKHTEFAVQETRDKIETVPLEKIIQKYDIPVIKHTEFAVQETRDKIENLESSTKKQIEIETPLEPTTEKTGFWNSVWHKTKKATNSVVTWFKN